MVNRKTKPDRPRSVEIRNGKKEMRPELSTIEHGKRPRKRIYENMRSTMDPGKHETATGLY
jgi:hypothetical protein